MTVCKYNFVLNSQYRGYNMNFKYLKKLSDEYALLSVECGELSIASGSTDNTDNWNTISFLCWQWHLLDTNWTHEFFYQ